MEKAGKEGGCRGGGVERREKRWEKNALVDI